MLDIITAVFFIATIIVISGTILIINDPEVPFNPFPLAEAPTLLVVPSSTITGTATPTATATDTPFPSATPTATTTGTATPTATLTPTAVLPNIVPTVTLAVTLPNGITPSIPGVAEPTEDTTSAFPFINREVRYEANLNEQGCQWLSIAGTVTGLLSEPVVDLPIEVIGDDFEQVVFSGSAPTFGLSGFEVPVDESPGRFSFAVRLLSPTGIPISDFVFFDTGDNCTNNVAVIEFVQVRSY